MGLYRFANVTLIPLLLLSTYSGIARPALKFTTDLVTQDLRGFSLAQAAIQEHLAANTSNITMADLKFVKRQESLLGVHYHFQQFFRSYPIKNATVIISVTRTGDAIYRSYFNLQPISDAIVPSKVISKTSAYDTVWQILGVRGYLIHMPKIKLQFALYDGKPLLTWQAEIPVSAPYGYWIVTLNAATGGLLDIKDNRIFGRNQGQNSLKRPSSGQVTAQTNRQQAFAEFFQRAANNSHQPGNVLNKPSAATGNGQVFDPDPRTTLADNALQDDSPAAKFALAYKKVTLPDITFDGRNYHLAGPWVIITDFDPPKAQPVTSPTGTWTYYRGQGGFNDVMSYYHIDKNQRYIQDLGYRGERGIQNGPIRVDSNGSNGADNSFYQPDTNSLVFGHGCVDDNEDADVIIHEYGHAITHSINSNFHGGDTGAIGEGFADYWAASYSYSSAAGKAYFPNQVFSWDGHGNGNKCWPGRILNAFELSYDPEKTYIAHLAIGDRFADELWSTPLFQSLRHLMDLGYPRSEVDQIIIEGQFGLGGEIKMRDLALATVQAAALLQPGKPHAIVLRDKFRAHNILTEPTLAFAATWHFAAAGANQVPDPGETFAAHLSLHNQGTLPAEGLSGSLEAQDYIKVIDGNLDFGDIGIAQEGQSRQPLRLRISDDTACGTTANVTAQLTTTTGQQMTLQLPIQTGIPQISRGDQSVVTPIPDIDANGVRQTITLEGSGHVSEKLRIKVDITHTFIADLTLRLISPSGKSLMLHDRSGGSGKDIKGTYPTTLAPADSWSQIAGEPLAGTWTLEIIDHSQADTGQLNSWGITDILGYTCDPKS